MMSNTLGARIVENRKRKGITQDQLAEHVGVSCQAVSKWENDLSCPDISLLPQLADYFNISVDALLRGKNTSMVQVLDESERKDFNKLLLKVVVNSEDGDIVNINLPLCLVKVGLDIGMQIPQFSGNDAIKNIDFEAIILAAQSGVIGKLIEVKSANGDIVEITIE
ncbi:MAG: helix-turn-helix transcriptional regulator [Hyphomonadaceae bacterium]|nr:helix-turn-helix transcriptional regulator [Clostridia bacterium]